MTKNKIIFFVAAVSGTLFIIVSIGLFRWEINRQPLPFYGQVQDFHLIDSSGKEFQLKQLRGKVWAAAFIFSTCGDVCPMMTKHMAALHRSYALRNDVAFVSITVNPEYDSPQILNQYAKKYNADANKWHFLTGPREMITELMLNSFKMGSKEEIIFHSTKFALVDRNGYIRGYYDGASPDEINQLFKDIARVLREWGR